MRNHKSEHFMHVCYCLTLLYLSVIFSKFLPWPSQYIGDLFSALYYVEHFHWSMADADRLSYTLVTFRAAVEYIRGKEVEKWLPKRRESAGKVSCSVPSHGLDKGK